MTNKKIFTSFLRLSFYIRKENNIHCMDLTENQWLAIMWIQDHLQIIGIGRSCIYKIKNYY